MVIFEVIVWNMDGGVHSDLFFMLLEISSMLKEMGSC